MVPLTRPYPLLGTPEDALHYRRQGRTIWENARAGRLFPYMRQAFRPGRRAVAAPAGLMLLRRTCKRRA